MLDVMDRASERLDLAWTHQKPKPARGPTRWAFFGWSWSSSPRSLPLLPDLHSEISKSWGKPYSFRLHVYQHADYVNIEGVAEHGYVRMPPFEQTFASYLSQGESSSLKAPALPSVALKTASHLKSRVYMAAGQAGGALHTMAVLQAYQADLLKDLGHGRRNHCMWVGQDPPTFEDQWYWTHPLLPSLIQWICLCTFQSTVSQIHSTWRMP